MFPLSIGKLTILDSLRLGHNDLEELPWRIGKLTALRELHCSHNRITEMPINPLTESMEFAKLVNLEICDYSHNLLKQLDPDIASMTVTPATRARVRPC